MVTLIWAFACGGGTVNRIPANAKKSTTLSRFIVPLFHFLPIQNRITFYKCDLMSQALFSGLYFFQMNTTLWEMVGPPMHTEKCSCLIANFLGPSMQPF